MDRSEYERIARNEASHFWYQALHRTLERAVRRELARLCKVQGARILDAGCGTGGVLAVLGRIASVVGFDISPDALRHAKDRGLTRLVRASIERIPFVDESFDGAVSMDVLYHRAVGDDVVALREVARTVKPGGFVILNLPAHDWLRGSHDVVIHTARRYTKARVREAARAAGLETTTLSWFNCALFPAVLALRLLVRKKNAAASDVRPLPGWLNAPLRAWLAAEGFLALRCGLPWGLSLFAVLRKPSSN